MPAPFAPSVAFPEGKRPVLPYADGMGSSLSGAGAAASPNCFSANEFCQLSAVHQRNRLARRELARRIGEVSGRDADAIERFVLVERLVLLAHRSNAHLSHFPAPALNQR